MSLIPLDDRRGDQERPPQDDGRHSGGVGRLWGHLKSLFTRLSGRLRPEQVTDEDTSPAARALPENDGQQVEAAGASHERLDLVCTEREGALTVSLADNPDASVTSDTWVRVER